MRSERSGIASALQTLIQSAIALIINFGTAVLTARNLGPAGRGELTAVVVWPQLFAWAMLMGLPQALIYNIRTDRSRGVSLIPTALLLGFAGGCIAAGAGMLIIPHWLGRYDARVTRLAQWALVLTPISTISTILIGVLQASDRFRLFNRISVATPFLTLVALLGLVAAGLLSPRSAALAYLLPSVPVLGWTIWMTFRACPWQRGISISAARRLLSYGARVWGGDLLNVLGTQAEKALLVGLLVPSSLGVYVIAQSLVQPLAIIQASIGTTLFPKSAGRSLEEAKALTGLAIRVNLIVVALAASILVLAAPVVLRLFFGPDFAAAVGPVRFFAVNAVLDAINLLSIQFFFAAGRPGVVAGIQALAVAVLLSGIVILVPLLGPNGAALAWLMSSVAKFVGLYSCFPLFLRTTSPPLLLNSEDVADIRHRLRH
jgi:O-antigen/teichoic acid export membrane protein